MRIIKALVFIAMGIGGMIVAPGSEGPLWILLGGILTLLVPPRFDSPGNVAEKGATEKDIIIRDATQKDITEKGTPKINTAETLDQRNRRVMLDHMENFWVKGVLEESLHEMALLELGVKEEPTAVYHPWIIKKEIKGETLPAGKSMLEIFQEVGMGRSLLILGAPGSGKTTMLLELTRQLIERARNDKLAPIPFVFNLASWTEEQSLADWLAEQLNIVYFVPKKSTVWLLKNKTWVTQLLLDGLDEVKAENRVKCIEAINLFRKEYDLIPMVVCSRVEEYSAIKDRLCLEGAITIQPLTTTQVNTYFRHFGKSLTAIKQLLKKDKIIRGLAKTPLMLSIMTLAYKDREADELIASGDPEEKRRLLIDAYVAKRFEHTTRTTNTTFSRMETLHYLSWLARRMIQQSVVTYQIELMQPRWIEKQPQRRLYGWYTGLILGLTSGLIGGLIGERIGGALGGLIGGLVLGLMGALVGGLRSKISMADKVEWSSMLDIVSILGQGLVDVALLVITGGVTGFLILMLIIWLIAEEVAWPIGVPIGILGVGLIGGLGIWLFVVVIRKMIDRLREWLTSLISEKIEETTKPGQHLKQTLYNSLLFTVAGTLISGTISLAGIFFGRNSWMVFGVPILVGLMGGFIPVIQHYCLRWILVRQRLLPRKLIPFLDYATELIFLRRVGGSYIFVHRLLMEYFAEMDA